MASHAKKAGVLDGAWLQIGVYYYTKYGARDTRVAGIGMDVHVSSRHLSRASSCKAPECHLFPSAELLSYHCLTLYLILMVVDMSVGCLYKRFAG